MSLASRVAGAFKPEYIYQPRVLLRRLLDHGALQKGATHYSIPGGATLVALAEEEHGRMLATLGVIDLPVTEALWRLASPGEICADVGANIGYMTGIFAGRMRSGTIHAFEAHPAIFEELERNVTAFGATFRDVRITAHGVAVSSEAGTVRLEMPDGFGENRGLAKVGASGSLEVAAVKLDDVFEKRANIGVMKLDVEGHELSVLRGAEELFASHRIRDCVFEEHRPFPTDVTTWFEEHGYTVLRIARPFAGPKLVDPKEVHKTVRWLPVSLLATCDAKRARERFALRGWSCLRSS